MLRTTFDAVAEDCGRVRPAYPAQLFDDLVALARLASRARLLEIGCGTGQATRPLARRGFEITCCELGAEVAAVARRKLGCFPKVEVLPIAFEDFEPSRGEFDAVLAFAAFHWVDPAVRYSKPARLLRQGGALAIVDWLDTLPSDGDSFFVEVEEDYAAVVPEWRTEPPPAPDDVANRVRPDIEAIRLYDQVVSRRYLWDLVYTAGEYVDFLNTRSSYRLLEDSKRLELFRRIRRRIEERPQQSVRKAFLADLDVALLAASAS